MDLPLKMRERRVDVTWSPEHVNFYTDTDIWELDRIEVHGMLRRIPMISENPLWWLDLGRNKR